MNYLEEDGIEHRQTTPLWPQTNAGNQIAKLYPEAPAYRSSRGLPLEIRDGQLLNDFDSNQHFTTARQNCCFEDTSEPNYPSPRVQHPR